MRMLPGAFAISLLASSVAAQQSEERPPRSPVLAPSVTTKAAPAAADSAITQGLSVVSSDGQAVGTVFEVIKTPDGRVNRILIDAPDGKHRTVPAANVTFEDGHARLSLSRAQLIALPPAQP